jgi:hypothetical protein
VWATRANISILPWSTLPCDGSLYNRHNLPVKTNFVVGMIGICVKNLTQNYDILTQSYNDID